MVEVDHQLAQLVLGVLDLARDLGALPYQGSYYVRISHAHSTVDGIAATSTRCRIDWPLNPHRVSSRLGVPRERGAPFVWPARVALRPWLSDNFSASVALGNSSGQDFTLSDGCVVRAHFCSPPVQA